MVAPYADGKMKPCPDCLQGKCRKTVFMNSCKTCHKEYNTHHRHNVYCSDLCKALDLDNPMNQNTKHDIISSLKRDLTSKIASVH